MKPAEAGTFDIVAGHVHGDEVRKGVMTIAETGQWYANLSLKRQVAMTTARSRTSRLLLISVRGWDKR